MEHRRAFAMRAGARRLRAFHAQDYYVSYTADPSLRLPDIDRALAGRKLGAQVLPFQQRLAARQDDGFDVARGGEITALAVARQLQAMGWVVGLVPTPEVLDRARRELPEPDLSHVLARLTVQGDVQFRVSTRRGRGTRRSQGNIEGTVRFLARHGNRQEEIFHRTVDATEHVTQRQVGSRTARARRAAELVLKTFVRRLLTDRQLGQALAREVRRGARRPR